MATHIIMHLVSSLLVLASPVDDDRSLDDFLTRLDSSSTMIEAAYTDFQATVIVEQFMKGKPPTKNTITYLRRGKMFRNDIGKSVIVLRPSVGFTVKPSEASEGDYVITDLQIGEQQLLDAQGNFRRNNELFFLSTSYYELPLSELFRDPDFRIVKISQTSLDSNPVVWLNGLFKIASGQELDISWYFRDAPTLLLVQRVISNGDRTRVVKIEYDEEINGVPLVSRMTSHDALNGIKVSDNYEHLLTEFDRVPPPAVDFSLTQFGLEDKYGEAPANYLSWLIAGLGCLLLVAWGFTRWRSHHVR